MSSIILDKKPQRRLQTIFISALAGLTPLAAAPLFENDADRIAAVFDGNYHDTDDISAANAALAMIAATDNKSKLVFFGHSCHVWDTEANQTPYAPPGPSPTHTYNGQTQEQRMNETVSKSVTAYGYNYSTHGIFDVFDEAREPGRSEDDNDAVDRLRDEINASSSESLLWITAGGPIEIIYQAISQANSSERQYIRLVSHSSWNQNHAEDGHNEHTWDELKGLLPNQTSQVHEILDQNRPTFLNDGFSTTETGAQKWNPWNWMQNHSDSRISLIYERMEASQRPEREPDGKTDMSDAGMIYYILEDDENGNPSKFRTMIENGFTTPVLRSAFNGPHDIPGTIEAEDFDNGGQGVAYSDNAGSGVSGTEMGTNTTYRPGATVDIANSAGAESGNKNIGWIANGEWVEYTVSSVTGGTYDIKLRVASGAGTPGSIAVKLGSASLGSIDVPNTGGYQSWSTITIPSKTISGGSDRVLRLDFSGNPFNLGSIQFAAAGGGGGSNLEASYGFNGDANDSSGNGRNGTLVGNPVYVTGVDGNAINLDGSGDYVTVNGYKCVTGTSARTVSAWIKTSSTGVIASWGTNAQGAKFSFRVQDDNGTPGAIRIECHSGYLVGSTNVRNNAWRHVAIVLPNDGSPDITEAKLYVDGVEESISASKSQAINTTSGIDLRIGSDHSDKYFTGAIDSLQIESRALTGSEITALASAGGAGGGGPVLYEAGQVATNQADDTVWHTVNLAHSFTNPIVVMGPPDLGGADPVVLRVRNVTSNSFQYQLDEWDYLAPGAHAYDTMTYLVIEAGTHTIGGKKVEAGSIGSVNQNFTTKSFAQSYPSAPVVITQCVTANDGAAVTTRLKNVSSSSFQVRVQEEEAADDVHGNETIHYLVWQKGTGSEGGTAFKAATTGSLVDHTFQQVNFGASFSNPLFLAEMLTYNGVDTAALRYQNLNANGVQLQSQEEISSDSEVTHPAENVGYIVFETN